MTESPPKQRDIYKQRLREEWGRWTSPDSGDVAHEVRRILEQNPGIFGGDPQLLETMKSIRGLDSKFKERGGSFFHASQYALKTAAVFTKTHIIDYRQKGRPSLPALAIHHAELMGLNKNGADYKALIMVAVRAEMRTASTPDYHNKFHYLDVAAMTANLLEKNEEMAKAGKPGAVPLTKHEQVLTFIAAIGHDLDHGGLSNPAHDPFFNEKKSYYMMEEILRKAGLTSEDKDKIYTILMTTSPNGPHAVMKSIALAQRTGNEVDLSQADRENKFPELHKLAQDVRLTQMAAIVSDADLYASGGAGLVASIDNSRRLAREMGNENLLSDQARKGFLDNIIGQGFASYAGHIVADKSLNALRKKTESRIANALKKNPAS